MNISSTTSKIASSLSSTQNFTSTATKLASSLSTSSANKRLATLSSSDPAALSIMNKATDLSSVRSTMQQQIATLDQGSNAANGTATLLDDTRKQTINAQNVLDGYKTGKYTKDELTSVLTQYQASYQNALTEVDQTSTESSFLTGGKMTLATASSSAYAVTVKGGDLTSEGLKLKTKAAKDSTIANEDKPLVDQDISQMVSAVTGPDDTAALEKIGKVLEARQSAVSAAEGTAIGLSKSLSAGVDTLKQSSEGVTTLINNLSTGAKQARETDMNDASASSLSQRTSVMLANTGASFAGQSDMAMLQQLFK